MNEQNECVSYEFGSFRVDKLKRQLFCDDEPVQVTSKAFDTLVVLLERHGETISKEDLLDLVWGETAVEENNLTQQISALRKALGEGAREHKFIVTVNGRGYSFVAPVRRVFPIELTNGVDIPAIFRWYQYAALKPILGAFIFGLIVASAVFIVELRHAVSKPMPQTIAVLPFRSADGSDDALGAGMRYTLEAKLGNLQEILNVHPTNPAIKTVKNDPLAAGRELNVDAVLDGTIQHDGDQVRVTVQMLDVADGRVVWGRSFDTNGTSKFAVQDSVASEVIRGLEEYYGRD
jgi:DNA-binding winged helix-turn-helix (wHTH) protein/TolB-like protein